jgi:hypothetical protein
VTRITYRPGRPSRDADIVVFSGFFRGQKQRERVPALFGMPGASQSPRKQLRGV